jgi:hypothetical protein
VAWLVPDVLPTDTELELLLAELELLAVEDELLAVLDELESSLDPSSVVVVVVVAVPSSTEVLVPVDPDEAARDATVALWASTLNPRTPTAATPATPVIRARERRMSASRSAPDLRLGCGKSSKGSRFIGVFMPGTFAPEPVPPSCLPCALPVNWMNAAFVQPPWMNAAFIQGTVRRESSQVAHRERLADLQEDPARWAHDDDR